MSGRWGFGYRWPPLLLLYSWSCASPPASPGGATPAADAGAPDSGPSGTPSPCESDWPLGQAGWERVCAKAPGTHFLSVWGSSPTDVYLVGGRPGQTVIWHFDGRALRPLEVEGDQRAWWVFGLDRDHVFVGGEGGLLLYRERGGPFRPLGSGTTSTIYGVWAKDPSELYFVTGEFSGGGSRGHLHRWTPAGSSTVSAPAIDAVADAAFFKVWGVGDQLWVVGERGTLLHFDGHAWTRPSAPVTTQPLLTVSGWSAEHVIAVGGRGRGLLVQASDAGFRGANLPMETPGLMGVHSTSTAPPLVSGENGFLATVVGDQLLSEGRHTYEPLHAVWQDAMGGAWAVGGNFMAPTSAPFGVVLRRAPQRCPPGAVTAPGYHHLDLQGASGRRRPDGTFPMFDEARGTISPELQHGEHYLHGPGAFVEFSIPLCADLGPQVLFRLPNNDEPGSRALHQLFVVRRGAAHLVAEAIDDAPGSSGYIPFDRSSLPPDELRAIAEVPTDPSGSERGWSEVVGAGAFATAPRDLLAGPSDVLLFRTTNLDTPKYGLMVWFPQRGLEYQSFLEVFVPAEPGGAAVDGVAPPPAGPCRTSSTGQYLGLDSSASGQVVRGPQGSQMLTLTVLAAGISPGAPDDPLSPTNPVLRAVLALDRPRGLGGRALSAAEWRRGMEPTGDHYTLSLQTSVSPDAIPAAGLDGAKVFATLTLVDVTGSTICGEASFEAHE